MNRITGIIETVGRSVGGVVATLYQSGRDTIEQVIRNILPFMAFISMLIGIILFTGIWNVITNTISSLTSNVIGLFVISLICAIPILSPLLGPGAVIDQVLGTLLGVEIGLVHIPAQYALPALFAIDAQVGCDFIPVGLALGEAEPETTEIGVPAVLTSRLITGPVAVVLAYIASIGMYVGK